ncbi:hypothetical protein JNL27_05485 [bacterium]|nr:hypothetical protein [bacterium]
MFDTIIESVMAQLHMKINPSQSRWSYYELTRKNADEVIRKIFTMRYEEVFEDERKRILSTAESSRIQYTSDPVIKCVDELIDEHKKNFFIPKSDIEKIIKDTLLVRLEYIIMPLATIEKLLYQDVSARSVTDVVIKFREFEKFRYYPDALEKYAHAKNITHLTKGQLRLLIAEINQSLFGQGNPDNVLKLSALIMKEINDLQGNDTKSIDTDLLMKAFNDRTLRDYEVALNIEKELGSEQINIYGLRQVLNRFNILKEKNAVPSFAAEPAAVDKPVIEKLKDTTDVIIEKVLKNDESGELIDIHQIISQKTKKEPTDQLKAPVVSENPKTNPEMVLTRRKITTPKIEKASDVTGEFIREELVESFSDDTSAIKLTALKESDNLVLLQSLIMPKDEKIFMNTVFDNDKKDYNEFISSVNRTKTWKEAIAVLDETLAAAKVDPYCKEAIRLSDIVYTRYYPPETTIVTF